MKFTIAAATTLAFVYAESAFGLSIDTPMNLVQCQPTLLAWHEGQAPYYLSIIPGGQPTAPAMKTFDQTNDDTRTWVVDIQAGTLVTLALKDNTGATAYSDKVMIQPGSDRSCLDAPSTTSASVSAISGSSSAAATTAGQTAAATSGSGPSAPPSNAPSPARPSGSQAAVASARPSNGAVRTSVTNGITGLLAVLGVALF